MIRVRLNRAALSALQAEAPAPPGRGSEAYAAVSLLRRCPPRIRAGRWREVPNRTDRAPETPAASSGAPNSAARFVGPPPPGPPAADRGPSRALRAERVRVRGQDRCALTLAATPPFALPPCISPTRPEDREPGLGRPAGAAALIARPVHAQHEEQREAGGARQASSPDRRLHRGRGARQPPAGHGQRGAAGQA